MGYILYGHEALDAAIRHHDLGRAGSHESPGDWPAVLADLAPAYFDHAQAERGVVQVSSPMLNYFMPATATAAEFTQQLTCAADVIHDQMAKDRTRAAEFGADLTHLYYQIELETHEATGGGMPGVDPGMRIAVARVKLPQWIHRDTWPALRYETRRSTHTTDYGWIIDCICRAWAELAAPEVAEAAMSRAKP